MAEVPCLQCGKTVSVPEDVAGAEVRCAECAEVIRLAQQELARADDAVDEDILLKVFAEQGVPTSSEAFRAGAPRHEPSGEEAVRKTIDPGELSIEGSWRKVQTGLKWVIVSVVLSLLVVALVVWLALSTDARRPDGVFVPRPRSLEVVFAGMGAMLCAVVYFMGQWLCASAPGTRSGTLAFWTMMCSVGYLLLIVVQLVLSSGEPAPGVQPTSYFLGLAANLVCVVGALLSSLFLKSVAEHFGKPELVSYCHGFFVFQVIYFMLFASMITGVIFLQPERMPGRPPGPPDNVFLAVALFSACFVLLGALIYIVWYLILLVRTNTAIDEALSRAAAERDRPSRGDEGESNP